MRLKLLVILLILGIHVSEGGKILQKLTKELKKVIDGVKFQDFISMISDDVAKNSDNIAKNSDNITENSDTIDSAKVSLSEDVANNLKKFKNLKVDVANNDASISSIDSAIKNLRNITNLKTEVAVNAANIEKNKIDIANYHPMVLDSIMVSTGYSSSSATKTSEVYYEVKKVNDSSCKDLEEYPLQIYGAVGFNMASFSGFNGLNMDSLPVICGGKKTGHTNPTKCYQMKSGKWNFFAHLTHGRYHAAGISHGQSFYIFGGINSGILSSTEIITHQGVVKAGPVMQEPVYLHAIARFNETTSIITGGLQSFFVQQINKTSTNQPTSNTWFFNHVSNKFSAGPSLLKDRHGHASTTIQDRTTNEDIVVVVGGKVNGAYSDTTELLFNGESAWQEGAKLPTNTNTPTTLYGSTAVNVLGDLYTVGGESNDGYQTAIFQLSCTNRASTWAKMTQKMKVDRRFSVAIAIPNSFCSPTPCTTNAHCEAKGDTGATCTQAYTGQMMLADNTCKCTDAQDLTPDCSG